VTSTRTRLPKVSAALLEKSFFRYWLSQLLSFVGDAMAPVALTFAVLDGGGSPTMLGAVLAAQVVAQVVFLAIGGVWADRLRSRAVLIVGCDLVRAVAQATCGLVLLLDASLLAVVGLQVVMGAGSAVYRPAAYGLIPSVVSKERLGGANAVLNMALSTSSVLGPAAAGALLFVVDAGWILIVDGITFLVSAVLVATVKVRATDEVPTPAGSFVAELARGWHVLRERPWLLLGISGTSLSLLFITAPFMVMGPLVASDLGGAEIWGLWLTVFSVGELVGSYSGARWRPDRAALWASASLILLALAPLFMAIPLGVAAIAVAELAAGLAIGWHSVLWSTTIQLSVPANALSRVSAFSSIGSMCLLPVGLVITGPVMTATSMGHVFAGAVTWAVLVTVVLLRSRAIRSFRLSAIPN
jgi:hypothetical protein